MLAKWITITEEYLAGALNKETDFQFLQTICSKMGISKHITFCYQKFLSCPNIHIMEVRSIQQGKERFSNNLDPSKRNASPPFALIGWVLKKVQNEKAISAIYPSLEITIMVSSTATTHNANTNTSTKNSEPFTRSKYRKTSLDRARKLTTPGMDSLRKRLHAEEV